MLAKSIHDYFWFGTCVRYLQDVDENTSLHGDGFVLENLESFFNRLDDLGLLVTYRASAELLNFLTELKKSADGTKLTGAKATELRKLMRDVRKTLAAELLGFEAYVVTPKRLDVKKLLGDVDGLFAPDLYYVMPDIASYDFAEAGKCIAFERPTAGAFHLLRGTESVLKE